MMLMFGLMKMLMKTLEMLMMLMFGLMKMLMKTLEMLSTWPIIAMTIQGTKRQAFLFLVPWIRQAEITAVNIETMRKTTPKVNIPEEAACSCSSITSSQSSAVLSMFSFQPGVISSISLSASALDPATHQTETKMPRIEETRLREPMIMVPVFKEPQKQQLDNFSRGMIQYMKTLKKCIQAV